MKYPLVPILKFMWAVFLTIYAFIILLVITVIYCMWEMKLPKAEFYKYDCKPAYPGVIVSPYCKKVRSWDVIYYKSLFHGIWNIDPIKK